MSAVSVIFLLMVFGAGLVLGFWAGVIVGPRMF